MVSIFSNIDDLEQLVGKKLPRDEEQLNELLYFLKCEISHPSHRGRIEGNDFD